MKIPKRLSEAVYRRTHNIPVSIELEVMLKQTHPLHLDPETLTLITRESSSEWICDKSPSSCTKWQVWASSRIFSNFGFQILWVQLFHVTALVVLFKKCMVASFFSINHGVWESSRILSTYFEIQLFPCHSYCSSGIRISCYIKLCSSRYLTGLEIISKWTRNQPMKTLMAKS